VNALHALDRLFNFVFHSFGLAVPAGCVGLLIMYDIGMACAFLSQSSDLIRILGEHRKLRLSLLAALQAVVAS
jgi:hypothetical protein